MSTEPESLRRELTGLAIAVLAINGLVGAGIFGLPSRAAALTGAFSPVIFVVCGLLMSTLMLSFAQAASYFGTTGGPILYTKTAFGPFVGFQTGWFIYVGRVTSLAANANLLATYLAAFVPGIDEGWGRVSVLFALAASFAVLNVVGVRQGMGSIMAITVLKFIPLVVFVLIGLAFLRIEPFAAAAVPSYQSFGEAVLLVFYAFIGFEGALIPAGETRDPKRAMPRAMIAVAVITLVLYVLIQTVAVATLPDLANAKRPLADAAAMMIGGAGVVMMTAGAAVSILGNYAASVLSAPRMTYALAREGSMPAWFAAVHERFRTPHRSVIFYCSLAFVLSVLGGFESLGVKGAFASLAEMSSFARLIGYALTVAALPRLAREFGASEGAFRVPGGLAIPAIAFVVCLWLVGHVVVEAAYEPSARITIATTALFVVIGAALYALGRRGARSASESTEGDGI